jgi:hypothetical protein
MFGDMRIFFSVAHFALRTNFSALYLTLIPHEVEPGKSTQNEKIVGTIGPKTDKHS